MDLIKLITDKLQEMEKYGDLEEIVKKHVTACVDSIVKDSFSWSGEAKKAIEKALEDKLGVSMEHVNIQQYNKAVAEIVSERVNGTSMESLKNGITEAIDKVAGVIEKKKWKLSEIMEKFIDGIDKSYDGGMESQYGECSLFVNTMQGFDSSVVYFDKEEKEKYHLCENKMHIDGNGKLIHVSLGRNHFSPFKIDVYSDFDKFMFTLYCNNVEIEIDEDDCELEYYREDVD